MRRVSIKIVGGGVAGLVVGLSLAQRGHACELFDAGARTGTGCSFHAGGMLAPISELDLAEPAIARLGLDAPSLWRALLGEEDLGDLYDINGSLLVAHRPEWPLLDQLSKRIRDAGLEPRVEWVGAERIGELEPWTAGRLRRGVWIPSEGVVHPRRLLPALRARALEAGVELREGVRVEEVSPGRLRVEGEIHEADTIVDCRGLGARPDLPLRGVRGEYIVIRPRGVCLRRPVRLMHPRYPLYLVPRPDGRLYVGATQLESDDDGPVHVRSALELLSALYSLDPGFADAEIEEQGVGLRPALATNLPTLKVAPGLISINGLFRHGFLLAPRLCGWAVDVIEGRPLPESAGSVLDTPQEDPHD